MKAMQGQLTLGALRSLVCEASDDGFADDAPIFWYLGGNDFKLQVEDGTGHYTVVEIKIEISSGGPA